MVLEPTNAAYLRDFGMSQVTGLTSIKKGRLIIEQALVLNSKDWEAHSFLALIYAQVPWALGGDKTKAAEHRKAFQEIEPTRFLVSEIDRYIWNEKDFPADFQLSESLLKKNPDVAISLILYGYTAAESKANVERGLAALKKVLMLPAAMPPPGNSPFTEMVFRTPNSAWEQIGKIERDLGQLDAARAAFSAAVKLDPANHWAAKFLAKL